MNNDPDQPSGVLPAQALEKLISSGAIRARNPIAAQQIQPSSLDLRLGSEAFRVRASFPRRRKRHSHH